MAHDRQLAYIILYIFICLKILLQVNQVYIKLIKKILFIYRTVYHYLFY